MIEFVSKTIDKINDMSDKRYEEYIQTYRDRKISERYGFSKMMLSKAIKEEIANELYFRNMKFIEDEKENIE